jgi:replication factor C small subunit
VTGNWNALLRPETVDEIVGNHEFVRDFRGWIDQRMWPTALLFTGPPGTGKTSAAYAVSKTMLGDAYNDMNVLWTNASDDRGINHIREEVKQFARLAGVGTKRKVIILDEADGLTTASQDALRGIIEKYVKRVLFILTANYEDKIRPAIKSRCNIYRFERVTPNEGARHLHRATESCGAPEEWEDKYESLMERFDGDLRAAVNFIERLPRTPSALTVQQVDDDDDWWDLTITHKWNELRKHLQNILRDCGHQRVMFMKQFMRSIRGHFDTDAETTFSVTLIWGRMMERVHEWPGTDEAFVDVLVARLKKELEN